MIALLISSVTSDVGSSSFHSARSASPLVADEYCEFSHGPLIHKFTDQTLNNRRSSKGPFTHFAYKTRLTLPHTGVFAKHRMDCKENYQILVEDT